MSTGGEAADPIAGGASNILLHQRQGSETAAYSRGNLARLFVGRSEAWWLSQVEDAVSGN